MFRFRFSVLGATLLLVPALVTAQGKSAAHVKVVPVRNPNLIHGTGEVAVFRDPDRTAFRDYFHTERLVVTPLPPGIAKNLARGKPLPPGIVRHVFPRRLVRERPGTPRDVMFVMVGHDMFAVRNGLVVDRMVNVFP